MKIVVYNDTAHYHAGCQAVMGFLTAQLEGEGHEIVASQRRLAPHDPKLDALLGLNFDALVVNGEGSLHHSRPGALWIVDVIMRAKELGKKVFLVNSVWQEMAECPSDFGAILDGAQFREGLSAHAFREQFGVEAPVYLDFSYYCKVESGFAAPVRDQGIARTDFLWPEYNNFVSPTMGPLSPYPELKMAGVSWPDFLVELSKYRLLLCGRHHALLGCMKTATKFLCLTGNSHKMEGVFFDFGQEMPVATRPDDLITLLKDHGSAHWPWDDFFDWAASRPAWPGLRCFD